MKHILLTLTTLFSLTLGLSVFLSTPILAVDVVSPACQDTGGAAVCQDNAWSDGNPILGPDGIVTKGLQVFVILVGITSVVVIMISGVKLATSGGNAENAASGRRGIIYAIVGVLIAVVAQGIVSFVLGKL